MRKRSALLLATLVLAGCGQGGGLPFLGTTPPVRKPGLWQETHTSDRPGAQPLVVLLCLDADSDKRHPVIGGRHANGRLKCDKTSFTKASDGSYVADASCTMGDSGASITSHTTVTGDFTSGYTVISERTISGSDDPARDGTFKSTTVAVYKGDCPSSLSPGQMQLPDGTVTAIGRMPFGGGGGGGGYGGGMGGASAANAAAPASNGAGQ
jgi:hypothetical protein